MTLECTIDTKPSATQLTSEEIRQLCTFQQLTNTKPSLNITTEKTQQADRQLDFVISTVTLFIHVYMLFSTLATEAVK